jgi:hypothetical protein
MLPYNDEEDGAFLPPGLAKLLRSLKSKTYPVATDVELIDELENIDHALGIFAYIQSAPPAAGRKNCGHGECRWR